LNLNWLNTENDRICGSAKLLIDGVDDLASDFTDAPVRRERAAECIPAFVSAIEQRHGYRLSVTQQVYHVGKGEQPK
jgi:hypothetical protein